MYLYYSGFTREQLRYLTQRLQLGSVVMDVPGKRGTYEVSDMGNPPMRERNPQPFPTDNLHITERVWCRDLVSNIQHPALLLAHFRPVMQSDWWVPSQLSQRRSKVSLYQSRGFRHDGEC